METVLDRPVAVLTEAVGEIGAGIGALLDADLTALTGMELAAAVEALEVQTRRLAAVDARLLAELDTRGVAGELGACSTVDLLRARLRIPAPRAAARLAAARDTAPRRTVTGQPVPPVYPLLAAAQAAGSLDADAARVIRRCLDQLPAELTTTHGPDIHTQAEQVLVDAAGRLDARALSAVADRLRAHLDPDGIPAREHEIRARRFLDLTTRPDGTARLSAELTRDAAAALTAVLDPLTAPTPATPATPDRAADATSDRATSTGTGTGTGDRNQDPAPDHDRAADRDRAADHRCGVAVQPDPRTAAQRRHDALLDACTRLLRSGTLPDAGGVPATILLTINATDLAADLAADLTSSHGAEATTGSVDPTPHPPHPRHRPDVVDQRRARPPGWALTPSGGLIPLLTALHLADQADIHAILTNPAGGIIATRTTRRLATPAQRRALAARDKGCSFPACTRPPTWCDAHHITAWIDGGPTTLDNLTLLCGFHHREFQRLGWTCHLHPTDKIPEWTPPATLDPHQQPQRNTAHDIVRI